MNKHYVSSLLLLTFFVTSAQNRTLASGKQVTGTGGSVSYSIGQIVDTVNSDATGSVSQGIQLGIEIFTLSNTDFENANLTLKSYPNPTLNEITVDINKGFVNDISFELYDMNSRKIKAGRVLQSKTIIQFQKYPTGIYILTINQNNRKLKTFKIIKR